jgi:hypothetical protein
VLSHGLAGPALEDALPHAGDLEAVAGRQQHFGLAEEQIATGTQGEVEPVDDLGLRLDVEVHQGIAADQQVEPGDRGVAGDVVAAEDHSSAQLGVEAQLGA